jgi:hypothetical protein
LGLVKKLIACFLLLAACKEDRPAQPTTEQSQQLNEAEKMLDDMAVNEEGPEHSPGPSNQSK